MTIIQPATFYEKQMILNTLNFSLRTTDPPPLNTHIGIEELSEDLVHSLYTVDTVKLQPAPVLLANPHIGPFVAPEKRYETLNY